MSSQKLGDVKVKAEGVVTHGPGTRTIIITTFRGNVPTDEKGKAIDLEVFTAWLTSMTDQWVVEMRTF